MEVAFQPKKKKEIEKDPTNGILIIFDLQQHIRIFLHDY